jgi:sugar O-acyltransferase (sialic acid O-acetyltransferase NeuD family)
VGFHLSYPTPNLEIQPNGAGTVLRSTQATVAPVAREYGPDGQHFDLETSVFSLYQQTQHSSAATIDIGLFGTSGFAKEVMPLLQRAVADFERSASKAVCRLMFVDRHFNGNELNGHLVVSDEDFLASKADLKCFNLAIADSRLREKLSITAERAGCLPIAIGADNVTIYDENRFDVGAIVCANSIVTSNATIGRYFHCNLSSYVAHDCVIGDYVTFAPGVHCNGNVVVEDHAYIGTGAIIKQGLNDKPLRIGARAVVGMGAVVTRDVPADAVVIGNPARAMNK